MPSKLTDAKTTDWHGESFAEDTLRGVTVDTGFSAVDCVFENLTIEDTTFSEGVTFKGSKFSGGLTLRNVRFSKGADFSDCIFEGPFRAENVECTGAASFYRGSFSGDVLMRAKFSGSVNFNESVFREAVRLVGWYNISVEVRGTLISVGAGTPAAHSTSGATAQHRLRGAWRTQVAIQQLSRAANAQWSHVRQLIARKLAGMRRRLFVLDSHVEFNGFFESEGQFSSVLFFKPSQVVFENVNLSEVYFDRTNLKGVRFFGVNFWQPSLKRNGLRDEVFVLRSGDAGFQKRQLPLLEETCRSARVALEENKSFIAATDFYVAEMEALRKQLPALKRHLFSIPALYRAVSRYGSNVFVAFRFLALLLILHFSISLALTGTEKVTPSIVEDAAIRSARLMLYQSDSAYQKSQGAQVWADLLFRLIGTAQLAMVVLAFRAKVKRS